MNHQRNAGRVAATAGAVAIVLGAAAVVGWVLDIPTLKSLLPGLATMKVNTAVATVFLGVALTLQINPHSSAGKIMIARLCMLLAVTAGVLSLLEYTFDVDLGIDQLLVRLSAPEFGLPSPGRMAPNTALSLTLLGTALLLLDVRSRTLRRISEILCCLTLFLSFIAIIGYILNVRSLYGVPGFSSMAIHTAAGFAVLSVGILAARPERGLVAIVIQDNAAGAAARRILPLTIGSLIVIAWLRLQGQYAGFYGTEFGLALIVGAFTAAFTLIVLWNASTQARAEKQIVKVQERMSALVDSAHDAIVTKDLDGVVRTWNPAAERMLGYRAADILGKSVTLLIPIERLDEEVAILAQITRGQKIAHFETVRRKRDGTLLDVELTISPIMDSNGTVIGASKIMRDIAERKRTEEVGQQMVALRLNEQQLRDASSVADKANKAKSEFLANMSHEIRTPLNAVIGLGYLLEQTPLSEDQRQFLAKIRFASRGLLNVVNNVLDLSKIEAGEMLLEAERFDLPELIRDLSLMLAPQAAAKGIELVLQTAADLPRYVAGDATRLRQVLTNLVDNSVKFTEAGQVELRVCCTEKSPDRIRLRCEVKDTGIGIEPAALAHLFTPFTQADTSTTRRFGGTGLGLSIARRFVELMGGEIGVTSIVGEGTTFWFEAPLRVARGDADQGRADGPHAMRIFIVSSIDEVPEALGVMIRALGWTPIVLGTVAQLADALRDTPPNSWPDVLIFEAHPQDTDMPRLIASLEAECSPGELPPVIIVVDMTRANMANTRSLRAHDATLARPVTSSALFNAINSAVWKRGGRHKHSLQSTHIDELHTHSLAGVRALVVDDSEINVEVAKRILEKQGAIVTTCSDGSAAVEAVRTQHLQLDIVLMDVQMPTIDGNEATRRIRNDLGIKTLPIMALTAGALMAERQRSIEAGMNDFITKPFEPLALIRKVRHLVEQARGAPIPLMIRDSRPATAAGDGSFMTTCIDAGTVQRLFGDDMPLFKSLLGRMLREFADLALPVSVHDEASRKQAMARVHKLKGSAGMIGAVHVMRFAGAAQKALQRGRPVEVVDKILRQLASALTTLAEDARPLLDDKIATAHIASPAGGAADRPSDATFDIRELQTLLEAQNLAALDGFNALSGALSGLLDKVSFDELRMAVDDLNFPRAAMLLREALNAPAKAVSVS